MVGEGQKGLVQLRAVALSVKYGLLVEEVYSSYVAYTGVALSKVGGLASVEICQLSQVYSGYVQHSLCKAVQLGVKK